uniref:Metalloendopeptidase n=1 Tax=Tetraodon nigroviridis TaxID=99883 RepID=Q2PED5_TETNG|nr:hatching enzyme [Tetraodon nigroviridis]
MTPCVSLLLLLLGLSQAQPVKEEGGNAVGEDDPVDISAKILSSNNGSQEILLEGDMVAPKNINAMKCWSQSCLWPKNSNGLVVIPYTIGYEYQNWERQAIETALQSFHGSTCIRFTPRKNEYDYIKVESGDGCYSSLGRVGNGQTLSINTAGCLYHGVIQHETMHALGFQHEQTRSDRDYYVRINWDNIDPNMAFNFYKQDTNNLNTPYDYGSVMHYGRTAFTMYAGVDTITPIPDSRVQIGQRNGLSYWDIQRVNLLYGC